MTERLAGVRCLVPGGAGYVGLHIADSLMAAGARVTILDNFYSGHRWAVGGAELVEADLADRTALEVLFAQRRFDAVIHCAAHIWVGEACRDPGKYYRNNTANTALLADLAVGVGIGALVLSSTAAVYGAPATIRILLACRSRRSIPTARRRRWPGASSPTSPPPTGAGPRCCATSTSPAPTTPAIWARRRSGCARGCVQDLAEAQVAALQHLLGHL